jgi:hypothetical protein
MPRGAFPRLAVLLGLLLLGGLPTVAQAQLEEQAARQIALAQEDLDAGNYERAVNSASSALRLNPLLYEALVIKALAYEKLNETMLAYSLLVTYQELSRGMTQNPKVEPALQRLRKLIGAVADSISAEASKPAPRVDGDGGSSASDGPVAQFEILSRRNQEDLFQELNQALPPGPAYARFRSQSRGKGDDFYFGLAEVRWDDGEADIRDQVFTLILDSEKLVTKARSGAKIPFRVAEAEHDVQVWYDGQAMAVRVDGEALGPFEASGPDKDSRWFLSLNDDARAWNLEVWTWDGSLAGGDIPSGTTARSFEATKLTFEERKLLGVLKEGVNIAGIPDTSAAPEVRVKFRATCQEKSYVLVRLEDGREVTVGRDIAVRGSAKMPKESGGLRCNGSPEHVEIVFAGDGAVYGSVEGREFSKIYPGRRVDERPELRVKGDTLVVDQIVYEVAARPSGRRTFRAEKVE